MECKTLYYQNNNHKKIVLIPGWKSPLPYLLINKIRKYYELLVILFPVAHDDQDEILDIEDFIDLYKNILKKFNFVPDIRIGHSFGGKILSLVPDINAKTYLICPSSFEPLLKERIIVKYKIYRNKLMKRVLLVFKKPIPSKYLGSKDYQSLNNKSLRTFFNIKDSYISKAEIKKLSNTCILAYKKDLEIKLKRIKKRVKRNKSIKLYILNGDHYTILHSPSPLLYLMEKEI